MTGHDYLQALIPHASAQGAPVYDGVHVSKPGDIHSPIRIVAGENCENVLGKLLGWLCMSRRAGSVVDNGMSDGIPNQVGNGFNSQILHHLVFVVFNSP